MANFLIIGASGGIGSALCRQLVEHNHNLMLTAQNADRLGALAQELGMPHQTLDARHSAEVEAAAKATVAEFGQLDGIVNLAGSILLKPAHTISDEDWQDTLTVNLTTAFNTVKAAAKTMRKNGGSVVLMSSGVARAGFANHEAISAAKAGVIGLMLAAAATYASAGIRVNAVAPGLVRTPLSEPVLSTEAGEQISRAMHALNAIGDADQVARMIAWLLDPQNDWVTGQVFGIDGGLGTVRPKVRM